MLKKIFQTGVREQHPAHLERKIVLSNQIALISAVFVGLPFIFISLLFFPILTVVPIVGIIACLGVLLLNHLGLIHSSRVILSLTLIALAAIYNAALSPAGAEPIIGIYIIELSFVFIPLIVFDFREKSYLFPSIGIAVAIFLSFDLSNQWIELDLDASLLQNGYVNNLCTFLGTAVSLCCIYILINESKLAEKRSSHLLEEARESNLKAEASENELKENLERLRQSQEEEKKRQWASEGLAQATKILRQYDDITQLYDSLISFIVHYIDANQGGLFIVDEEGGEKIIELKACYAYERKKHIQKRVEIGEGLIGQTYLEREYIYMTDIPLSYVNITSGLGMAPPRNLLIVPLMANETIEGIIELASFKKMEEHEIQFINTLGESIASTVRNVKINQKTKELLAESQQQTEEMRAQEEEMRQNMEELQATQEEMTRKQKELEQIKIDLEMKQQEVEKVRESEKARAEAKIATQKKSMNAVLEKMKEKEASYQKTVEEQEQLIAELKKSI